MHPPSKPFAYDTEPEDQLFTGDGHLRDYSHEEVRKMLEDAEGSGMSKQSLDEIFTELFEKNFGRKPSLEERSTQRASKARL